MKIDISGGSPRTTVSSGAKKVLVDKDSLIELLAPEPLQTIVRIIFTSK